MAEQDVPVPSVAESVSEVTLLSWYKKPGEAVEIDEALCEVETDKANTDIPSPIAGVITQALAKEGDTIRVGDVIAKIDPDAKPGAGGGGAAAGGGGARAEADQQAQADLTATAGQGVAAAGESMPTAQQGGAGNGAVSSQKLQDLSPAVRRLVSENNLDPASIPASGPGGRLTKEDIESYLDQQTGGKSAPAAVPQGQSAAAAAAAPQSPTTPPAQRATGTAELPARPVAGVGAGGQPIRREPMSKIRKRIAQNLVAAQQNAAILTTFNEVDLTEVMKLRKSYKEPFEKKYGVGLGFMSFFAKATCEALKEFERVNARIDGEQVVYHDYVNLGIAVSTERGLTVPVLKNVQDMSFAQIESEIKRVALAARDGKLGLAEMSGGTFTITNGGVFGSLLSTPIINPPQSGILGMHTIQERPMAVNGEVKIRPMMYIALSYDHRLVDGKESVSFLVRIKQLLEDPARLMLGV